jgi:hypothetical protein
MMFPTVIIVYQNCMYQKYIRHIVLLFHSQSTNNGIKSDLLVFSEIGINALPYIFPDIHPKQIVIHNMQVLHFF